MKFNRIEIYYNATHDGFICAAQRNPRIVPGTLDNYLRLNSDGKFVRRIGGWWFTIYRSPEDAIRILRKSYGRRRFTYDHTCINCPRFIRNHPHEYNKIQNRLALRALQEG